MVTRKITRHVHVIGIAVSLLECLFEHESEDKLEELMDHKVDKMKSDVSFRGYLWCNCVGIE